MSQSNIVPDNCDPEIKTKSGGYLQRCKDADLCRKGDCTFSHGNHQVVSDRVNKPLKIGGLIGTRDWAAVRQAHDDAMKAHAAKQEAKKANKKVYDAPASTVSEHISRIDLCGTTCAGKKCALRHCNNPQDEGDLSQINQTPDGVLGLVKVPFNLIGHEGVNNNGYLIGERKPAQSAPVVAPAPVPAPVAPPKKSYVAAAAPAPTTKSSPAPAKATSSDVVIAKHHQDATLPGVQTTAIIQALTTVIAQVNGLKESVDAMNNNIGQTVSAVNCATGISVSTSMALAQQANEMSGLIREARADVGEFGGQLGEAIQAAIAIERVAPMSDCVVQDINSRLVNGK